MSWFFSIADSEDIERDHYSLLPNSSVMNVDLTIYPSDSSLHIACNGISVFKLLKNREYTRFVVGLYFLVSGLFHVTDRQMRAHH
jgi:hypothetical protein